MSQKKNMMLAVKVSLFANVALFTIKFIAMLVVNSLAIAADLGISCVSLAVSAILYYAIKMSDKPADFFHNYGYSKVENVCELIEGAVLIGLSLAMSFQAIMNIVRPEKVHSPMVGFICSILGILINFWGASFIIKLAKRSNSPALKAEGIHFRLEGYISTAITLSFAIYMVVTRTSLIRIADYIDPVVTLLVSALIFIPSARLMKEAFKKLLDASIGEAGQIDVLRVLAKHIDSYCDFKDIRTRTAGRKQFIELHLVMPEHSTLKSTYRIVDAMEKDILSSIPESDVKIRIEPCKKDCVFFKTNRKCPYEQQ
ncbi:MAG TPA: cation diffusion facilitator family transporter [Syntrophorhabdaceae bacterium]|jgi:cation diffusion facilitator family transporter|nr:cation diffusion facilitator family transporter [Syntrophorhabdaceae bacterium]